MDSQNNSCPVCETPLTGVYPSGKYDCPRCGEFILTSSLEAELPGHLSGRIHRRGLMSHKIRRMERKGQPPKIDTYAVKSFWADEVMPTPPEQADELILWAGDNQRALEQPQEAPLHYLGARVCTSLFRKDNPHAGVNELLDHLANEKILKPIKPKHGEAALQLTVPGWQRYAELKKRRVESRTAFMAMKFGDLTLDVVVKDCFKPAVARTGFDLRVLTDQPKAGLIDDHMRAALLASRFTIADLSHGSHGAYWEAGFAEGLNRPVFYTCKASVWEEQKSHFDTNHLHTIVWDENNLKKAGDELTASIRATLRDEAEQND